jgi:spore germination cell wall hydrolase CwlJ-like protein
MWRLKFLVILWAVNVQAHPELHRMAEAIYYEADGESLPCKILVAQTILNRVDDPRFPSSVEGVVTQRKFRKGRWVCQFSYLCDGFPEDMSRWNSAYNSYKVAQMVLDGEVPRLTNADHYYNPKKVTPSWSSEMEDVVSCDGHVFGRVPW